METAEPPKANHPIPIIIDTDIGEDIDDLLVIALALNSPEFEVLAITTVDGDTAWRSRIARRLTGAYGRPHIPVVAGYPRSMPAAPIPWPRGTAVRQGAVAPDENGLPPECPLRADELIAKIAAERPGEVYLLMIGSMTNVGQTLVRHPETAGKLKAIVTNGGNFADVHPTRIGWNLRYDPLAAATVARSEAQWVLLSEHIHGLEGLRPEDVQRIAERKSPTTGILLLAIQEWRRNKKGCTPESVPHLSDLNVLAFLLGLVQTSPGQAHIVVGPRGTTADLRIEYGKDGPHQIGWRADSEKGAALHDLVMQRLLADPR